MQVEALDHGAVVVRGLLGQEEQRHVLETSFDLRNPDSVHRNERMYTPLFTWRWPGDRMALTSSPEREREQPGLFDRVVSMGRRAFAAARDAAVEGAWPLHQDPRLRLPNEFEPGALRGILYPEDGQLHAHQDMLMGWVMSLSLGRPCEFFFGTHWEVDDDSVRVVTLRSGDFIFLNGQTLHHGVLRLRHEDPAPDFWREMQAEGLLPARWHRFNLQMRDARRIR